MAQIKKILCAVDFSEHSPAVAEYARIMAQGLGASIDCLYVAPSLSQYVGFHVPPSSIENFVGEIVTGAEATMSAFLTENFQGVQAVGRLDQDTTGLLLLTDDKALTNYLLNPMFAHPRTYWVQVDGAITPEACRELEAGVVIAVDGKQHVLWPDASLRRWPVGRYLDHHQSPGHHGVIYGESQPAGSCRGRLGDAEA